MRQLADSFHPMIVSILRYLESGADFSPTHRQWDNTVPWQWGTDYKEFEVSRNYWKAIITIKNMRYLQAFGKR